MTGKFMLFGQVINGKYPQETCQLRVVALLFALNRLASLESAGNAAINHQR